MTMYESQPPLIFKAASLMDQAEQEIADSNSTVCWPQICAELTNCARELRAAAHLYAEAKALGEARDKLGRKHFEERVFTKHYISTITRDPKTGWLVPVGAMEKDLLFARSLSRPEFYKDDHVQAAWEGYKIAMQPFEI